MKKLRTLKDFGKLQGDGFKIFAELELKAEAIKWIKELERSDIEYTPYDSENKNELRRKVFKNIFGIEIDLDDEYNWQYTMRSFLIDFIKHFFNITEEELSK